MNVEERNQEANKQLMPKMNESYENEMAWNGLSYKINNYFFNNQQIQFN